MPGPADGYAPGMPQPQQPELRRSGRGSTDDDSAKTKVEVAGSPGAPSGAPPGTPEANRPGHHPGVEQDKPDGAAFARRLGIPTADDEQGADAGKGSEPAGDLSGMTKAELLDAAREAGVSGYSRMNKAELADAVRRA
jgi:hypothetical protein